MNSQNEPTGTPSRASRTVYPSFYAVVHEAWDATAGDPCDGDVERYEPDEHACFSLAGAIRVGLHAAGISLSSDPPTPERYPEALVELEHAIAALSYAGGALLGSNVRVRQHVDAARFRARAFVDRFDRAFLARQESQIGVPDQRLDRTNSRRVGPDPEDREPLPCSCAVVREPDGARRLEVLGCPWHSGRAVDAAEAWRHRLADADAALYDGQDGDEDDDPGNDTRTGFRALLGRLIGPWKVF